MDNTGCSSYKGFSVQPLVYLNLYSGMGRYARFYDVAVRIWRENDAEEDGRVFALPMQPPFESLGDARRAGVAHAQRIINGEIPGLAVEEGPAAADAQAKT